MVDRMGEIRAAQLEAFGQMVDIKADQKEGCEGEAGFWVGLTARYTWSAGDRSSTGLVTIRQLSIPQIAEDLSVLAQQVHQLRCSRYTSELEAKQLLKGVLVEANFLHTQALERMRTVALDNAQHSDDDWGVRACRENLHARYGRLLLDALQVFHESVEAYRQEETDEARRRLKQVGIEDETKVEHIISNGLTEQVMQKAMSENVSSALESVQLRHQSILQLEREVSNLKELFLSVETLVDLQQKSIDSIQSHIYKAKDHVSQAQKSLSAAQKDQKINRKLTCCVIAAATILLAILAATVAIKTNLQP